MSSTLAWVFGGSAGMDCGDGAAARLRFRSRGVFASGAAAARSVILSFLSTSVSESLVSQAARLTERSIVGARLASPRAKGGSALVRARASAQPGACPSSPSRRARPPGGAARGGAVDSRPLSSRAALVRRLRLCSSVSTDSRRRRHTAHCFSSMPGATRARPARKADDAAMGSPPGAMGC
jgi:hypothetical protein